MYHITILVPEGPCQNLSSIVGSYKVFKRAEEYWQRMGNAPRCTIELAGIAEECSFHDGVFTARPHKHINEVTDTNLVIIPAHNGSFTHTIELNKEVIPWLINHYGQGASIASMCTGAFILAATGLLDGKRCSTHWGAAGEFRRMYPNVQLVPDQIITDEDNIFSSGGAYSFLNLVLYLVEKYYDRATAVFCAKVFEIDIERVSQSPYIIFLGQKHHGDDMVIQAQLYMEQNALEKISVEELATRFAIGRRNFDRRFRKATGNSPAEYHQRVKVEAAKKCLETTRKNVNEVMYDVGYTDIKAFRTIFKKITGLSPLEYRNKYNRDAEMAELKAGFYS